MAQNQQQGQFKSRIDLSQAVVERFDDVIDCNGWRMGVNDWPKLGEHRSQSTLRLNSCKPMLGANTP